MLLPILAMMLASTSPSKPSSSLPVCNGVEPAAGTQSPSIVSALRMSEAWFQASKTANDADYIALINDRGPKIPGGPSEWLEMRSFLSNLQICGVKSVDSNNLYIWVFDKNVDSFAVTQLRLNATISERPEFVGVFLTDEAPLGYVRPEPLTSRMLVKAVEERVGGKADKDHFSGAVLISHSGRIIFQKAYGLADKTNHKPNTLDTQFRFGSMGKMFTAVAIMQLVQDSKIDLDAPIGRYLTGYPNSDVATKVTVANLLTHTGGTGDIFGPEFDRRKGSLHTLKDYVALYGSRALEFDPGSRSSYSNYGFILLGRIVETVSGLSYDDYTRRYVFAPAGMTSTGNDPERSILPRRAVSYMGSGTKITRADDTLPLGGTSAGGGYSTVGDFNRFVNGLTSYQLLRRETFQRLKDGGLKTSDGHFTHFDFGGSMARIGPYIGHGGGAPGMSGSLFHFLQNGYTIVVLANRDPGTAESISNFTAHRLPAN